MARKPPRRRTPAPPSPLEWAEALRLGRAQAEQVLERRRQVAASRRRRPGYRGRGSAGLLVAEGDSWFDYPFFDTIEELEEVFGYEVLSVAHKGDTVEEMAYDPNQLDKLARALAKLACGRKRPKAVLLSGGGNDIAGAAFGVVLNHRASGLPPLNERVVEGVIDDRLRAAILQLASAVTHLCRETLGETLPILMHGYDYPVPDGRGYLGGFWLLPGPWLSPGFVRKGYDERTMALRCELMVRLIDRFNALLSRIAGGPGLEHLHHVDLRGTLSQELPKAYREWWGDELHPTEPGFRKVAAKLDAALRRLG
jgi:hypothetical protein